MSYNTNRESWKITRGFVGNSAIQEKFDLVFLHIYKLYSRKASSYISPIASFRFFFFSFLPLRQLWRIVFSLIYYRKKLHTSQVTRTSNISLFSHLLWYDMIREKRFHSVFRWPRYSMCHIIWERIKTDGFANSW